MIYPIIVINIMVGIGILMMLYVMPSITSTFVKMNTELPTMTVIFMEVSNFVNEYLLLTLGSMMGSVIGFIYFLKTNIGKKLYAEIQNDYVNTANALGLKAYELQAITWVAWRRIHEIA